MHACPVHGDGDGDGQWKKNSNNAVSMLLCVMLVKASLSIHPMLHDACSPAHLP